MSMTARERLEKLIAQETWASASETMLEDALASHHVDAVMPKIRELLDAALAEARDEAYREGYTQGENDGIALGAEQDGG